MVRRYHVVYMDGYVFLMSRYLLLQSKTIASLRRVLADNEAGFYKPGAVNDQEVADIESEIGEYIRECKRHIDGLQRLCSEGMESPSHAMERAHRQGCVLILAERLKQCIESFEIMQRARVSRLEQSEQSKMRRTPHKASSKSRSDGNPMSRLRNIALGSRQEMVQEDVQLQSENFELQQDLSNLTDQVQRAEQSVREIASLNQAFSAAVFHQAEQIETLYEQAVEASHNIEQGNVQLEKTIRVNKSSQKCMFVLLLSFSLFLLFLDWFYS